MLLDDNVVKISDDFDHGASRLDYHDVDDGAEQVGGMINNLHDGDDHGLHAASPQLWAEAARDLLLRSAAPPQDCPDDRLPFRRDVCRRAREKRPRSYL